MEPESGQAPRLDILVRANVSGLFTLICQDAFCFLRTMLFAMLSVGVSLFDLPASAANPKPPPEVDDHLRSIAMFAKSSPKVRVPAGWFLMGTDRKDDDPFGLETQFDDTELPQRPIWIDEFEIDRYEVSLGEYLAFLQTQNRPVPERLRELIWHLISVHFIPDAVLAPWPAMYATWSEAVDFCQAQGKRLPRETEWEKAARGSKGNIFPWGRATPTEELAVFGQYHVHEIPLIANVDSFEEGQSPYGLHHMSGNVAEWVKDWFGFDYYAYMPDRNPPGPTEGRYKGVRGGSWRSKPHMLRAATRGGAFPSQRAPTIGFRCARNSS
jgi:formylglycine-generating enzyme required for sulfatase activity